MTFSAAPGGSTRSKARSALEKGDAVADHLGEAFPVLGKYPRDLPWARGRRCLCRTGLPPSKAAGPRCRTKRGQ
jgi:hypothetical protein